MLFTSRGRNRESNVEKEGGIRYKVLFQICYFGSKCFNQYYVTIITIYLLNLIKPNIYMCRKLSRLIVQFCSTVLVQSNI